MSESDLLSHEQIDGLDGLENGQDGDALMHNDNIRRDFTEANIDDPVSSNNYFFFVKNNIIFCKLNYTRFDF